MTFDPADRCYRRSQSRGVSRRQDRPREGCGRWPDQAKARSSLKARLWRERVRPRIASAARGRIALRERRLPGRGRSQSRADQLPPGAEARPCSGWETAVPSNRRLPRRRQTAFDTTAVLDNFTLMPPANLAAELLTVEDYRATPEGTHYQLVAGDLIMAPAPNLHHQRIVRNPSQKKSIHSRSRLSKDSF